MASKTIEIWPDGRMLPEEIKQERRLIWAFKKAGYTLIPDRTRFWDAHYRGGYMIARKKKIIAGRDFDLTFCECEKLLAELKPANEAEDEDEED